MVGRSIRPYCALGRWHCRLKGRAWLALDKTNTIQCRGKRVGVESWHCWWCLRSSMLIVVINDRPECHDDPVHFGLLLCFCDVGVLMDAISVEHDGSASGAPAITLAPTP
jgi:hypothetical protein